MLPIHPSSTLSLSKDQHEESATLPYPAYIPLATGEDPPLRPHEKIVSLVEMALASVGKSGVVIEDYLPSDVKDQLILDRQRHERFRNNVVHCCEELKEQPERKYTGGWNRGVMFKNPVYRPLELAVQESLTQDWMNLDYCYEGCMTLLLLLLELQLHHAQYDSSVTIHYLKKALQTHRASFLNLVQCLYRVCGRHDDIVLTLRPYLVEHLSDNLPTTHLEECRELFVRLARQERLVRSECMMLSDFGRKLGFTREFINQLIRDIVLQPTEDVVRKVETIYVLVMAGGDINELVIDGKNGLVKLIEVICQDEVWPLGGSDAALRALLNLYTMPRTI